MIMRNNKITICIDKNSVRSIDENGYMHVQSSHITKATVNPYYGYEIPGYETLNLKPDEIYYGFRDPQELKKSLPTWAGLPLHLDHHIDSAEDPQKDTRVGTVGTNIVWNDPYIDAPLIVWDQTAIDGIKDGSFRELSCAYRYDPDMQSGEFNGEKFDFIMRNIRGNHVALVENGRAGPDVLVADAALQQERVMNGSTDLSQAVQTLGNLEQSDLHNLTKLVTAIKEENGGNPMADETKIEGANESKQETELNLHDAMDSCGLNCDDESLQQAFAKGVEYGVAHANQTGTASKILDERTEMDMNNTDAQDELGLLQQILTVLPELTEQQVEKLRQVIEGGNAAGMLDGVDSADTQEQTAADEDETETAAKDENGVGEKEKPAEDKALMAKDVAKIRNDILKGAVAKMRATAEATRKVRPLVGDMDPFAFDSAEDVYASALKQLGVDVKQYSRGSWRAMIDVYLAKQAQEALAQDAFYRNSKPIPEEGPFKHLSRISLSSR